MRRARRARSGPCWINAMAAAGPRRVSLAEALGVQDALAAEPAPGAGGRRPMRSQANSRGGSADRASATSRRRAGTTARAGAQVVLRSVVRATRARAAGLAGAIPAPCAHQRRRLSRAAAACRTRDLAGSRRSAWADPQGRGRRPGPRAACPGPCPGTRGDRRAPRGAVFGLQSRGLTRHLGTGCAALRRAPPAIRLPDPGRSRGVQQAPSRRRGAWPPVVRACRRSIRRPWLGRVTCAAACATWLALWLAVVVGVGWGLW